MTITKATVHRVGTVHEHAHCFVHILQPFLPGVNALADDEVLEADASAYVMLHSMNFEWSALSFDIIPDKLGMERTKVCEENRETKQTTNQLTSLLLQFPMTCTFVCATQADRRDNNKLILTKATQLGKTQYDDKEDDGTQKRHRKITTTVC
jgi:ribosome assembly protein RRB1